MRTQFILLAACVSFLWGCTNDTAEKLAKLADPRFPKVAATHIVQLTKVQFAGSDLNESTFNEPLDVEVKLLENGVEIPSVNNNALNGARGERILKQPVQWIVNFKPENNYQIVIQELAIIAKSYKYWYPDAPKIGYWPFAEQDGKLGFGDNSYLKFTDVVAK
jgi:hypothetical protein